MNHTDDLFIPLNNKLEDEDDEEYEEHGRGLDAAVDVMSLATRGEGKQDEHPERRRKVCFKFLSMRTVDLIVSLSVFYRLCTMRTARPLCRCSRRTTPGSSSRSTRTACSRCGRRPPRTPPTRRLELAPLIGQHASTPRLTALPTDICAFVQFKRH